MTDDIDLTVQHEKNTPGRRFNNFNSGVDPGVTDDESKGYERGSRWLNRNTGFMWECVSAKVGEADWRAYRMLHSDLTDITTDDHHAEVHDLGSHSNVSTTGAEQDDYLGYESVGWKEGNQWPTGSPPVLTGYGLWQGTDVNDGWPGLGTNMRMQKGIGSWYGMDFGSPKRFFKVQFHAWTNNSYPQQFWLMASNDEVDWTEVARNDNLIFPGQKVDFAPELVDASVPYRYWRFYYETNTYDISVSEHRLWEAVDDPEQGQWLPKPLIPEHTSPPSEIYESAGAVGDPSTYAPGDHVHPAEELTAWKGLWLPISYRKNDMVRDSEWLAVANQTPADDRPAPQPTGSPFWASTEGDTPAWLEPTPDSTAAIYYGQRYTFGVAGYIESIRFWMPASLNAATAEVWLVEDPGGPAEAATVLVDATEVVTRDEWVEIPVATSLVRGGTTFDMVVVLRSTEGVPVITTADWSYNRDNSTTPALGQVNHNSTGATLTFSKQDFNSNPQGPLLEGLEVGDTIAAGGQTWAISAINDISALYIAFDVVPTQRLATEGPYTFTLTSYPDASMSYVRIDDHFVDPPHPYGDAVKGFYSAVEYDAANMVLTDHMYGMDILLQEAFISDQWDFMAISGGGGGGGSGEAGPPGAPGSVWWSGAGAPTTQGIDGDYYLDTDTGDVYTKVAGSWGTPIDNLTGPQGDQGDPGTPGAPGAPGTTLHSGLTDVTEDQHHAKSHTHDGVDGSGQVGHAAITGVGTDDHHPQAHVHDGLDGSGSVPHASTTGRTSDDHHAEVHNVGSHSDVDTTTTPPTLGQLLEFDGTNWVPADKPQGFSGDHADLTNVGADQHHTRYTDAEASLAAPVQEAPIDGERYLRKDGIWEQDPVSVTPDHDTLTNVTPDQHHQQAHDHSDVADGSTLRPGKLDLPHGDVVSEPIGLGSIVGYENPLGTIDNVKVGDTAATQRALAWDDEAVSDHGALTGLTDDDHPQHPIMVSQTEPPADPAGNRPTLWFDTDAESLVSEKTIITAKLEDSGATSTPTNVSHPQGLDTVVFDTDGMTGVTADAIVIQTDGYYDIIGRTRYGNNVTAAWGPAINIDGTDVNMGVDTAHHGCETVAWHGYLTAGAVVRLHAHQSSGVTVNMGINIDAQRNMLSVKMVGGPKGEKGDPGGVTPDERVDVPINGGWDTKFGTLWRHGNMRVLQVQVNAGAGGDIGAAPFTLATLDVGDRPPIIIEANWAGRNASTTDIKSILVDCGTDGTVKMQTTINASDGVHKVTGQLVWSVT